MATPTDSQILFRMGGAEFRRTGNLWLRRRSTLTEPEAPTFTRADATTCATLIGPDSLIYRAGANKVRMDWLSGSPAVLLEGARTNLCLRSINLADGLWTAQNTSVGEDTGGSAPDGGLADTLTASAGNFVHNLYQAITATAVPYTASIFARGGTVGWLGLSFGNAATAEGAFFNLNTGAIGAVAAGTVATITKIGNFYRCTITRTLTAAGWYLQVEIHSADNQGGWNAAGTETLFLWGAQFELGSHPSSYIGTVAASVTRAGDALSFPAGFASQDITVYVNIVRPLWADLAGSLGAANLYLCKIGGNTGALIYGSNGARNIVAQIGSRTVSAAIPVGATIPVTAQFRYTTDGTCRLDVGSGYSALSAATDYPNFGTPITVVPSDNGGSEGYVAIRSLIIARGLFTMAEMQAIP